MAGKESGSAQVACPFYRAGGALYLDCEGAFEGANIRLQFRDKPERQKQMRIFCSDQYKRCEIYRCIIANKYPEEGGE